MTQIRLTYIDQLGSQQTVLAGTGTVCGRLSTCGLSIQDGRLSREHCRIDGNGTDFFAADLGSSNGTRLNGNELSYRTRLYDGDVLSLGGLEIKVRIESVPEKAPDAPEAGTPAAAPPAAVQPAAAVSQKSSGGFPWVFIIAPVMAFIVLLFAGGIFLVVNSGTENKRVQTSDDDDHADDIYTNRRSDDEKKEPSPTPSGPTPAATQTPSVTTSPSPMATGTPAGPSGDMSENAKVEHNAALFLRKIGDNDPKAFLTTDQATMVGQKIRQITTNAALAANLASARQQSSRISSLVASKQIKPGFLAIASVNRLGGNRGDVVKTAESILPVLEKLYLQIGTESSDDAVLIIAAYEQGAAGETMKMRNLLQSLPGKFPNSSREIRSIWFLKKHQQMSDADFQRALTFLAIGTIAQNPKDFGVNVEPLGF